MRIPAADLGLMTEHLQSHEGEINKLHLYRDLIANPALYANLQSHMHMLQTHALVMLELINPARNGYVALPALQLREQMTYSSLTPQEQELLLELRSTAKMMGNVNYQSAQMMKDSNVRHVHLLMAYQNSMLQDAYTRLLQQTEGELIPLADMTSQQAVYNKFSKDAKTDSPY
jgi:signal transduction histidine kinase